MRILFAGVELAGWTDNPARDVAVNGAQTIDIVSIVGASNKRLYPRGNSEISLTFNVTRVLSTMTLAEVFATTHFDTTTKTGTCEIQCGWDGSYQSVYLYNAVIESAITTQTRGLAIDVSYVIKAAQASTSTPPQFLLDVDDITMLHGSELLTNSATYHDVTFSTPFTTAPTVLAKVAHPSGGEKILTVERHDLITVNGFRTEFVSAIPASGSYYLKWFAGE